MRFGLCIDLAMVSKSLAKHMESLLECETLRGRFFPEHSSRIEIAKGCWLLRSLRKDKQTFRSITSGNDPEIWKLPFLSLPKILLLVTSATRFTAWIEMGFGQSQSHIPMWIRSASEQRTSKHHRIRCFFHHHPLKTTACCGVFGCPCLTSCRFQLVDLSYSFRTYFVATFDWNLEPWILEE